MTVRARAPDRPPLAHRLTVPAVAQTPGDAGPLYYTACLLSANGDALDAQLTPAERAAYGAQDEDEYQTPLDVFAGLPMDKLPVKAAGAFVTAHQDKIELMELAATREHCRWGIPLKEQGFRTLLPALSRLRQLARLVVVKARWQVATGDPVGAVRTLRANVVLARHLGNEEVILINGLVGAGIASLTLRAARDVCQHPDAPNLYWPLAELPSPWVDLTAAFETERVGFYATFPELRKAREGAITPEEVNHLIRRVPEFQARALGRTSATPPPLAEVAGAAALTAALVPAAREYFLAHGMPADRVAAMHPAVAVGRYMALSLDEVYDDAIVAARLPYWQAEPLLRDGEATLRRRKAGPIPDPFVAIVPSFGRVHQQRARLDREVAMLMAVEAVRAYAPANGGRLPARLEDVTATPVPLDPVHGRPFAYRVEGRTVTLQSAEPPGGRPQDGAVLRVTVAP